MRSPPFAAIIECVLSICLETLKTDCDFSGSAALIQFSCLKSASRRSFVLRYTSSAQVKLGFAAAKTKLRLLSVCTLRVPRGSNGAGYVGLRLAQ